MNNTRMRLAVRDLEQEVTDADGVAGIIRDALRGRLRDHGGDLGWDPSRRVGAGGGHRARPGDPGGRSAALRTAPAGCLGRGTGNGTLGGTRSRAWDHERSALGRPGERLGDGLPRPGALRASLPNDPLDLVDRLDAWAAGAGAPPRGMAPSSTSDAPHLHGDRGRWRGVRPLGRPFRWPPQRFGSPGRRATLRRARRKQMESG